MGWAEPPAGSTVMPTAVVSRSGPASSRAEAWPEPGTSPAGRRPPLSAAYQNDEGRGVAVSLGFGLHTPGAGVVRLGVLPEREPAERRVRREGRGAIPVRTADGWAADTGLGAVDDAGLPTGAEVVDDLRRSSQPDAGADGASPPGEYQPYFADGTGAGGTVHAEPAGQHVMSDPLREMEERGQEPVDEHQPAPRAGTHSPLPRRRGQPCLVTLMP